MTTTPNPAVEAVARAIHLSVWDETDLPPEGGIERAFAMQHALAAIAAMPAPLVDSPVTTKPVVINETGFDDTQAALADPAIVHLNMLRGGIAKPTPANIWHLYGDEALLAAMPASARSAMPTPGEWRSIESAPRDGTPFDAWVPDAFGGRRMTGLSFNRRGQLRQHGLLTAADLPRWPTHWQPLPPPPLERVDG